MSLQSEPRQFFSVRGDGVTTVMTDQTSVSAFIAESTSSAGYTGSVAKVQAVENSSPNFKLLEVAIVSF